MALKSTSVHRYISLLLILLVSSGDTFSQGKLPINGKYGSLLVKQEHIPTSCLWKMPGQWVFRLMLTLQLRSLNTMVGLSHLPKIPTILPMTTEPHFMGWVYILPGGMIWSGNLLKSVTEKSKNGNLLLKVPVMPVSHPDEAFKINLI